MRRNVGKVSSVSGLARFSQIFLIRVPYAAGEFPIPSSLPRHNPRGYSGRYSRLPNTGHPSSRTPDFAVIGRSIQIVSNPLSILHISELPLPILRDPCGCGGRYPHLIVSSAEDAVLSFSLVASSPEDATLAPSHRISDWLTVAQFRGRPPRSPCFFPSTTRPPAISSTLDRGTTTWL